MTQHSLKSLRSATEGILAALKPEDFPNEAINWADLHCTEAKFIANDDGVEYMEVSIEEASPECGELHKTVRLRLEEAGWKGVIAVTEW